MDSWSDSFEENPGSAPDNWNVAEDTAPAEFVISADAATDGSRSMYIEGAYEGVDSAVGNHEHIKTGKHDSLDVYLRPLTKTIQLRIGTTDRISSQEGIWTGKITDGTIEGLRSGENVSFDSHSWIHLRYEFLWDGDRLGWDLFMEGGGREYGLIDHAEPNGDREVGHITGLIIRQAAFGRGELYVDDVSFNTPANQDRETTTTTTDTRTPAGSFQDGFEDGSSDGWSPLWLPENSGGPDSILNEWEVTEQSALPGDYSLQLHSESDHNAIVTDEFVLDLSADFEFSFQFYFEDDGNRGGKTAVCDTDENGSRNGNRVSMDRLSALVSAYRQPAKDAAGLNVLGDAVAVPIEDIDPGTPHTVRLSRTGSTITGYLDDRQVHRIDAADATTDLDSPYRLVMQSSGDWGSESKIWWDSVKFSTDTGGEDPPTATTTTTTQIPTTTTTEPTTRTTTPETTATTTEPITIDSSTNRRAVDIGYATRYVHTGIDGYDPEIRGVTDSDDRVVPPEEALDTLLLDSYQRKRFSLDWDSILSKMWALREQSAYNQLFGQAIDIGWDLTEILVFYSMGQLPAAAGPTFEILSDVVTWNLQDVEKPYRQAFQEITAGTKSVRDSKRMVENIQSYSNAGTSLRQMGGMAMELDGLVRDGATIGSGWGQMLQGINPNSTTSLSTASSNVISQTSGIFLSQAVGAVVGEIEGVIKAKTTIHAIINALASCQIPLLREIQTIDQLFEQGDAVAAVIPLYTQAIVQRYQMLAIAYETVGNYWQQISDSLSGGIWDIITDAQEKADDRAQKAAGFRVTMQAVHRLYGRALNNAAAHLANSPTAEAYDPPRGSWYAFVRGDIQ